MPLFKKSKLTSNEWLIQTSLSSDRDIADSFLKLLYNVDDVDTYCTYTFATSVCWLSVYIAVPVDLSLFIILYITLPAWELFGFE